MDKNAEYHGGSKTPSPNPLAPRVEEVVKYTDTDQNGFLDTIEYDYDLTTPEIDKLASASAIGERYDHGYWIKEKIFRQIRTRIRGTALEKDLTRLYYTGQFEEYARRIAEVPGI